MFTIFIVGLIGGGILGIVLMSLLFMAGSSEVTYPASDTFQADSFGQDRRSLKLSTKAEDNKGQVLLPQKESVTEI